MRPNLSAAARLAVAASRHPDHIALVHDDGQTRLDELHDRSRRVAGGLADGDVRAGDRVAYLGFNSPVLLETLFAASHLGAVFLPLNFRLAAREIAQILLDAEAHTIVVEDTHRVLVEQIRADVPVRRFVLAGTPEPAPGWQPYATLL